MRYLLAALLVAVAGCRHASSPPPVRPAATTRPTTAPTAPNRLATAPAAASIEAFQGEYRFLSNFWPAEVQFEGVTYPSSEHAYQAAKTVDVEQRKLIAALATPEEAKRAGRALKQREDWEAVKLDVMERCVFDKFRRHPDLRQRLLATGDAELVEGNTWNDRFWGVYQGEGENHLGRILMKVRSELRGGQ